MYTPPIFRDRVEAGRALGKRLKATVRTPEPVVLALPSGGVPVGFEVAVALHAALDIFLVRKLGVPGHEELAMGAIASGGTRVLNESLIRQLGLSPALIESAAKREGQELVRRETLYREGRLPIPVESRPVILVDDGLATGATMLAAARALRQHRPLSITVAVPVASADACEEFQSHVDEVVWAFTPEPFYAVGVWYQDFSQTSDAEVRALLERAAHQQVA